MNEIQKVYLDCMAKQLTEKYSICIFDEILASNYADDRLITLTGSYFPKGSLVENMAWTDSKLIYVISDNVDELIRLLDKKLRCIAGVQNE